MVFNFDLTFLKVIKLIPVSRNRCPDNNRNRPEDNIRSFSNKLQIKSMWNTIANKFNIERSHLSCRESIQDARVTDNLHSWIGSLNRHIDGDVGDCILNSVLHPIGDTASKSRRDLKVHWIPWRDRIGGSVSNCCQCLIGCSSQFRDGLQPLTRVNVGLSICS